MSLTLEDALLAIERDGDRLRALSPPTIEAARARAAALGASGGPLHGVPYCLKDVWDVAGLPTTRGSARAKEPARESGPVHRAFEEAGAILVGKSNLSDLGLTPECESFVGGVTVHPEDPTRTPGGSSGGAAAAVAAGMAAFDWGTDFGGSIRLPAALCGVVGMRLSHASWPPPGSERDARPKMIVRLNGMGPIARDLATCRAVLDAAAPRLRRSAPRLPPFRGLLVLAPDRFSRGAWAGFAKTLRAWCARAGVPAWDAPLPPPARFDDAFVRLIAAHSGELAPLPIPRGAALSALTVGRLLGDRRLHPRSAEVVLKLAILRRLHRRDARAAEREASALKAQVDALFADGFVLVTPTTTHPAPRRGTALRIRGLAAFVKLGNLVDATALSVPFGRFAEGLPRAISLVGPPGSEHRLLDLAGRLGLDGSCPGGRP